MDVIIELLQIFKKDGLRSAGLLGSGNTKTLPEKYMLLVLDKGILDDDLLAKKLYKSNKGDAKYKNLKKRVKRKLLDGIPLMDKEVLGFKSEYSKAYYECLQVSNQVTYLSKISAYNTLKNLIQSKYKIAEKFQFYDVLCNYSYHLTKIHALRGHVKKAQVEHDKLVLFLIEQKNIQEVQSKCLVLLGQFVKTSNISKATFEEFSKKLRDLESINSQSFEYNYWILYTKTYYFMILNDSKSLFDHMSHYENILEKSVHFNPSRICFLAILKATVLIQLKQYQTGLEFCRKNISHFKTKQNNWSLMKRYEFCNAININPTIADHVIKEVRNSDYFKLQNNNYVQQLWLIHNAYLQFLLQHEKHPQVQSFNLYKFINDVDIYSKDKSGYNFSIIVIELMFYLLNDDIDKYIDKMTALMSYRLRHLNTKSFKRSNVFAQLLLDVEKKKFDPNKLRKSSQKKYDYLASLEDRLSINEWEIIGYDRLWEIVLELLENR